MRRFVLLVPLAAGCATHADRLGEIRSAYHAGNAPETRARLDAALAKNDRDADVLKLDKATALLTEGRPKEAEALFREVRDKFEEKEGRDLREVALAAVTDDQRLAYPGEDHEKVLVRFYLALCNLLHDGSDATAYALQVNQKQQAIIDAARKGAAEGAGPKDGYKLVAAGAYLHAALREATHTDYDDAARSFEQVAKWQPEFAPAKADLERAKTGRHSQPGHGAVYVFAMVGRGPYKEERAEVVTQAGLLVADRVLSAVGKHTLPPTLAPVKVPVVVRTVSTAGTVEVGVGGRFAGRTATLTDVGLMASEQGKAVLPEVLGRAVARRVVKKGVVYGAKEVAGAAKNGWASIALDVAGVAWEATEAADTRCWGLLPDKIQVFRLELPAGEHQLTLQPAGAGGSLLGAPEVVPVTVADGRNTYVLATYPGAKPAGKAVVSRP